MIVSMSASPEGFEDRGTTSCEDYSNGVQILQSFKPCHATIVNNDQTLIGYE